VRCEGSEVTNRAAARLGHVPALDGVRGIAIAAVLAYHAFGLPGGFLGVDMFFVLSGFLITTLLLEEHADTGRISFRGFYRRRARRLLPAAIFGVLLAELLIVASGGDRRSVLPGLYSLLYVENLAHFLNPPATFGVGHYWSLSQEEQFYFLWPPMLALALRRRVRVRWLLVALSSAVLFVIAHRMTLADGSWRRFYFAPDTRCDGMLLGCLLAVMLKAGLISSRRWGMLGLPAMALFIADAALMSHTSAAAGLYGITLANLASALTIGVIVKFPTSLLPRMIAVSPLRSLGRISYGLYIWQPLIVFVTGISGIRLIGLSFLVASLSYRYIELPFRTQRRVAAEKADADADLSTQAASLPV
jgi:peptidoglycan/LPS O-acetylase OafA/YrhL